MSHFKNLGGGVEIVPERREHVSIPACPLHAQYHTCDTAGEEKQIHKWESLISRPFSPNGKTHRSYQLGCIELNVMIT